MISQNHKNPNGSNWVASLAIGALAVLALGGAATYYAFLEKSPPEVPQRMGPSPAATPVTLEPVSKSEVPSSSASCLAGLQAFYNDNYAYQICLPADWEADTGSPPDLSRVALGPKKLFRPLILISVFKKTDLSQTQELLLSDAVVLKRDRRAIAGMRAEQLTIRATQGAIEKLLFFEHGEFGFAIVEIESLEEEHVDQVFDKVLSSFRFQS